jgi:L-ascorbate metabolism protein UlaG (beta-lactamase superfamily)
MYPQLYFLDHSGFLLELEDLILIFDYYRDPAGLLNTYAKSSKPFVFFVSHKHADHWNPRIMSFRNTFPVYYILDSSCNSRLIRRAGDDSQRKLFFVGPDTVLREELSDIPSLLAVYVFGSTDEGSSFLVVTSAGSFIHTGDLNDWDWQDEDSEQMEADYNAQLSLMASSWAKITEDHTLPAEARKLRLAFVPVDKRLEEMAFKGALTFLDYFQPGYLIPMHLNGGKDLPAKLASSLAQIGRVGSSKIAEAIVPGQFIDIN